MIPNDSRLKQEIRKLYEGLDPDSVVYVISELLNKIEDLEASVSRLESWLSKRL